MSNNKSLVPEAREGLDRFKMEAASEVGVTLKQGYNGDLTSKQAGSVGGQMVKKMIQAYEQNNLKEELPNKAQPPGRQSPSGRFLARRYG